MASFLPSATKISQYESNSYNGRKNDLSKEACTSGLQLQPQMDNMTGSSTTNGVVVLDKRRDGAVPG